MIGQIIEALKEVGLTPEEVDAFAAEKGAVEGGRGTHLAEGNIGGCIHPNDFLKLVGELLEKKETEK